MLGSCSCSVATVVEAVRRCDRDVGVLLPGEALPDEDVLVIPSVAVLRGVAPLLEGRAVAVIVTDAVEVLRTVGDLVILDAPRRAQEVGWQPGPLRMDVLREHLAGTPAPLSPLVVTVGTDVDELVRSATERGVLGAVLAYSKALSSREERDTVQGVVYAYLGGRIGAATMERRTRPRREAQEPEHRAMCAVLTGTEGTALVEAVRLVARGMNQREAAEETGADAFECGFACYKFKQQGT